MSLVGERPAQQHVALFALHVVEREGRVFQRGRPRPRAGRTCRPRTGPPCSRAAARCPAGRRRSGPSRPRRPRTRCRPARTGRCASSPIEPPFRRADAGQLGAGGARAAVGAGREPASRRSRAGQLQGLMVKPGAVLGEMRSRSLGRHLVQDRSAATGACGRGRRRGSTSSWGRSAGAAAAIRVLPSSRTKPRSLIASARSQPW